MTRRARHLWGRKAGRRVVALERNVAQLESTVGALLEMTSRADAELATLRAQVTTMGETIAKLDTVAHRAAGQPFTHLHPPITRLFRQRDDERFGGENWTRVGGCPPNDFGPLRSVDGLPTEPKD